jgi:hypothetical protein
MGSAEVVTKHLRRMPVGVGGISSFWRRDWCLGCEKIMPKPSIRSQKLGITPRSPTLSQKRLFGRRLPVDVDGTDG